jgi:peptide/nickel transport system substrate-binding protein
VRYDVDAARKLMADAGYSRSNPLRTKFLIASDGTGQMLSVPMNEFVQQNFAEIGIALDFRVVELEPLYVAWRQGAAHESLRDITANNVAYVTSDPLYAFIRFFHTNQIAPTGVNWSHLRDAEIDALMAKVHERVVDEALLIWVVHDTNPRVLGRNARGYIQAQHWFQDLTTLS